MDLSRVVWRKSRRSDNGGANCVEIASVGDLIAVRNSKKPEGPNLAFDRAAWEAFTNRIRGGEHDL
ncbi:DUF397 domain-containing protein [Actinomadura sp. HBU206391]|uniref:DUF397 domain-containing protein n=1 Tax=Actinomadura sp. HBU206391 TaxID=2731692 RepID=UPI001650A5B4|nr:DUF397 domain-containing protein [Actinomadura sp. HBU206391]MBC6459207.1 DUF397 domain-containing protein [Actinomadura sp. HBU206391]